MPNYNKLTVMGHLGRDAEARTTATGTTFCVFPLAVTEYAKKKDGDGFLETTTWIDCTCWDKFIAEKITRAGLKKGAAVMVAGPVSCRAYAAKDGSPRAQICISVKEFVNLERRATQNGAQGGYGSPANNQPAQQQNAMQNSMQEAYEASADDDLPF